MIRSGFLSTTEAPRTWSRPPTVTRGTSRRRRGVFGTGNADHLRSNVTPLLKPLLPDVDRAKLAALFGHLTEIGLDGPERPRPA